jgi:hypothetical protein
MTTEPAGGSGLRGAQVHYQDRLLAARARRAKPGELRPGTGGSTRAPVAPVGWRLGSSSVDDGLIDELPEERAMVQAQGACRLHHEDGHQFLLGIHPEHGAGIAAPVEITS